MIRVAVAQTVVATDVSANGKIIRQAIGDVADQGPRLVTFCEGALSGYAKSQVAHARLNGLWICAATSSSSEETGHVVGPDDTWISHCSEGTGTTLALAALDREDPAYHDPLKLAQPWRLRAKAGEIYRNKLSTPPRRRDRTTP